MNGLRLTNKCTGCSACVSICKPGCISMQLDENGFFKAYNTEENCDGCGHCKIVCPALHEIALPARHIIAFQHRNPEILSASASGGAFTVLALEILSKGGVVYGVTVSEEGEAHYARVETPEKLGLLRGSKYIDVDIGNTGRLLKADADSSRPVLFVGLPCTVAGLKRLVRNRPNVLWVDLLCFGKPSRGEWDKWIRTFGPITRLNFKDLRHGVSNWGVSFVQKSTGKEFYIPRSKCPPLRDWLDKKNLDPQCLRCSFHGFDRPSDITLGDFWGIESILTDLTQETIQKGVSMVLFNTDKSMSYAPLFDEGQLHVVEPPFAFDRCNGGLSPHGEPKHHGGPRYVMRKIWRILTKSAQK